MHHSSRHRGSACVVLPALLVAISLGLTAAPSRAQYASTILASNPVAYYRLGELSGTTVVNSAASGAANNASIVGSSVVLGQSGAIPTDSTNTAYGFSGDTSSYVSVSSSTLDSLRSSFTLEYWFNTTATQNVGAGQWYNGAGLVDAEVSGVTTDFGTSISGGSILFGVGNPDTTIFSTSTTLNDGNWHLVDASWSTAGTMQLFVDGVLQSSLTTAPTDARTAPGSLHIGDMQTNVSAFNGKLDEVALYNAPLSASQIQAHYNAAFTTSTAAPEPGAAAFLILGLPLLGVVRGRRHRAK